jgi:CheY-like chemotaxis protein
MYDRLHLPARLVHAACDVASASELQVADVLPRRSVTMSIPFFPEHLACIRDDARRIVECARSHEDHLSGLIRTTERAVRQATELSRAFAAGDISASAAHLQRVCSDQLSDSVENADAAHRACVGAREQHVAARRLLSRIDTQCPAADTMSGGRSTPTPVLVVDDVADLRDMVAVVLRDAGFLVRTAVNGLDALLVAHEMQPSVIVMDVTMPVLDGLEATRLIKASEGLREAKVIAYTGNGSIPDASVERWFVAILPKTSTPDVVVAAVQHAAGL